MTCCIVTGRQCVCQPDEGCFCPERKADWYEQCLQRAINDLRAERNALWTVIKAADAMRTETKYREGYQFYDVFKAYDTLRKQLEK